MGEVLRDLGFALDIRCPALGHPLPANLDRHSGTMVFGGPMSANDDHLDFISQELNWITLALAAEKPYLGICLGAQLLARALGASVTPHPTGRREIGYYPILPTPAGQGVFPGPLMVYQWHQEGFTLPQGSHLLATGTTFPHEAFGYGKRAYGLQFHPEITATMVNHWTTEGADQLTYPGAQGRAYHLSQHRLYGAAVEGWLRRFLADWLGVTPQAEAHWEQHRPVHHSPQGIV
ncbi:glutamine amidotransferase [Phormidium sp. FACHB-322]|nr:glutamine amidotransferase [Phormidium sp. FACHB-77]MBD2033131.1 glutamine amidotransferase [Phormidium sp. FACHB-322]MBD2054059.1 glutamine amidotransferase [Leptolyngbya sp. FACHB-60]